MSQPPVVAQSDLMPELAHLLSLVQVEMSLLGDSSYQLGKSLSAVPSIEFARNSLPFKRGKTVVTDYAKLAANTARIAELLVLLEQQQKQPSSVEHTQTSEKGDR